MIFPHLINYLLRVTNIEEVGVKHRVKLRLLAAWERPGARLRISLLYQFVVLGLVSSYGAVAHFLIKYYIISNYNYYK